MDQKDASQKSAGEEQSGPERTMLDVLDLPEEQRRVVQWLLRQSGATASEVSAHLALPETAVACILETLNKEGFLEAGEECDAIRWRVRLASKRLAATPHGPRRAPMDIWKVLED